MAVLSRQIYVNLPVKDLNASKAFFKAIGFEFNMQFSDEKAACLVVGENIFAMLLQEEYFRTFTNKDIADTSKSTEVLIAISADSREDVDGIASRAIAAGAKSNGSIDHGFMYQTSFDDLDGHTWEVAYMDPSALEG
ncbi:glyoxalase/bleomycin resistance/extradiol dioxygenase family protein [Paenibacillus nanensis]|uniref:Glyoxalase/bleomycin resistance/extradiol dioxygenase family protein n=1 Tax=Paenibacillus nanensis TaxID=393251 RepID=A0A3A1V3M6_9BACL|nr:VOC family protein [Paenibacillus nanensis]RIX53982.1 glyoxalase/bleomycin resistance/extradiol dioxygenase family protein [Paenibacillus nanensis]